MTVQGLAAARRYPQKHNFYLVIQQPINYDESGMYPAVSGYVWYAQVANDITGDPVAQITVTNPLDLTVDLLDSMTVLIGSSLGTWDKGIVKLRTDQSVDVTTTSLLIGVTSELRNVEAGDYLTVLNDFKLWQRYSRIDTTDALEVFKDYDIAFTDLGASDDDRFIAMLPPVPIMGTHIVKFLGAGEDVTIDYDWSDSYVLTSNPITDYYSYGDDGGAGWTDATDSPSVLYDKISGLAGYRTVLEVDDGYGNNTTLPFRRGVRYIFTLRRPGETQIGDPDNAEPIIDFEVGPVSGSFDTGYWQTSIKLHGEVANKYKVLPNALVILFTDSWYADDTGTMVRTDFGLTNSENIMYVGYVADGSIEFSEDLTTVSFDVKSAAQMAAGRITYPVSIQDYNLDSDASWLNCKDLVVDRALWYYITWHTTLSVITDFFIADPVLDIPVLAWDADASDIYATANSYMQDRALGRLLFDKYGRAHCTRDAQVMPYGYKDVYFDLQQSDLIDNSLRVRHLTTKVADALSGGGILYAPDTAVVTPFKAQAPGIFNAYEGTSRASTSLAIEDQDELNELIGRAYAAMNHEWEVSVKLAGAWKELDIVDQQVMTLTENLVRDSLVGERFFIRDISYEIDMTNGVVHTTTGGENETDGIDAVVISIDSSLPTPSPTYPPRIPPSEPTPIIPVYPSDPDRFGVWLVGTAGRGVYKTPSLEAGATWVDFNNGFPAYPDDALYINDLKWDTFLSTDLKLLVAGTNDGIWKINVEDDTPAWQQVISGAGLKALAGLPTFSPPTTQDYVAVREIRFSIEQDGLVFIYWTWYHTRGAGDNHDFHCAAITDDKFISMSALAVGTHYYAVIDNWSHPGGIYPDMHSDGQHCYLAYGFYDAAYCMRSLNQGASWSTYQSSILSEAEQGNHDVYLPYDNPDFDKHRLYWLSGNNCRLYEIADGWADIVRKSYDAGVIDNPLRLSGPQDKWRLRYARAGYVWEWKQQLEKSFGLQFGSSSPYPGDSLNEILNSYVISSDANQNVTRWFMCGKARYDLAGLYQIRGHMEVNTSTTTQIDVTGNFHTLAGMDTDSYITCISKGVGWG